jgi:hypothetical protein
MNTIWLAKSTNDGAFFSAPVEVATFTPFDSNQFSGNGSENCGDGPFACPSGFTFERFASLSAVAADATGVHVVWNAERPGGQAKIFVRNSPDGVTWPTSASTLDSVPAGDQCFPDIASSNGVITVVFYDSRNDPAYSPQLPPGDTASGMNSGGAVDTFAAQSADGGLTWSESRITTVSSNFNRETHGSARLPFWGDYIYMSSVRGTTNMAWTDSRNLVPGDPCLSKGGLDQNIYQWRV